VLSASLVTARGGGRESEPIAKPWRESAKAEGGRSGTRSDGRAARETGIVVSQAYEREGVRIVYNG